ncbi:MAG: DNA polymerase III subunit beta [Coriobacteriia bacterium]|nr:DNA polymerase III subunit beta [Coriobacteriia bacterium]
MSSRSTLPILSGIHLETEGGSLVLRTTDLEISIQHTVSALVEREGATVVPGKLFSDIIKSFPEAAVTLNQKDDNLTVSCLDSIFTIHTLNPIDFPLFPQVDTKVAGTIPADVFSSMIRKVVKAVSKDESRAILTGVLVKLDGSTLQMVATDSYRLAIAKNRLEKVGGESFDLIVPGEVLDEIRRLISAIDEVTISDSENQIVFTFGETTFITRKIEGSYPNYEAIIPTENSISVVVETAQLLEAVKRVSITTQPHTPIRLTFSGDIQSIDVTSKNQDVASAHEKLAAQIDGEFLEIGFNHQYIIDGLVSIDTNEVLFEAQTSAKPGIFKSIGDDYFYYLTMPVRLDS